MLNEKLSGIATSLLQDINETYARALQEPGETSLLEIALLKKQVISFYEIAIKLEKAAGDAGVADRVSSHLDQLREQARQVSEHQPGAYHHPENSQPQSPVAKEYQQQQAPPAYQDPYQSQQPAYEAPPASAIPDAGYPITYEQPAAAPAQKTPEPVQSKAPEQAVQPEVKEKPIVEKQAEPEPERIEEKPAPPPEKEKPIVAKAPEPEPPKAEKPEEKEEAPKMPAKEKPKEEPAEEPAAGKSAGKQSLNERFAGRTSLHERLGKPQQGLADKFKLTPVGDLKSAISLNKKIAFINDLFKGNQKEYRKTIDFVNKSSNYSEARFYLQSELKPKYDWHENDPLYRELLELVQRKFL